MKENGEKFSITAEHMNQYLVYLIKKGYRGLTIEKYNRDITVFGEFLNGAAVTKELAEA